MEGTLKNLSLMALARTFWYNEEYKRKYENILLEDHHKYKDLPIKLISTYKTIVKNGKQIESLELCKSLEVEFMLAIVEFGKKKSVKRLLKIPRSERDEMENIFHNSFSYPDAWIQAPGLGRIFPQRDHQQIAMKLCCALFLPDILNNRSAIIECWTSPTFASCQTMFLELLESGINPYINGTILDTLLTFNQIRREEGEIFMFCKFLAICAAFHIIKSSFGEILPWFVFEVLNTDQRDKFLALKETALMTKPYFAKWFATILCHWPWRQEAFKMVFKGKERLNECDLILLKNVMDRIKHENKLVALKMISPVDSFYLKVERLYNAHIKNMSDAEKERIDISVLSDL